MNSTLGFAAATAVDDATAGRASASSISTSVAARAAGLAAMFCGTHDSGDGRGDSKPPAALCPYMAMDRVLLLCSSASARATPRAALARGLAPCMHAWYY